MTTITALVADHSAAVHRLFRQSLRDNEAVRLVHAKRPADVARSFEDKVDLAFIDVHASDMVGVEALWRARSQGDKTFVTLMTGQRNERCVEIARKLEAYELLVKPFRADDIRNVLALYERISTPMRVLVVDDSAVTRKITRKVLSRSIFRLQIDEASGGDEALARCDAEPFDVVFLDCNMPDLDGLATLVGLRSANPQISVVMISGERQSARESEAMRLGAAAFMHKPFFPGEIEAVMHQVLGLHSPRIATDTSVRDFGIRIHGRTIAVEHRLTQHSYQYVWFRDPPHLRLPSIRENPTADASAEDVKSLAERVALLELANARLLNAAARLN